MCWIQDFQVLKKIEFSAALICELSEENSARVAIFILKRHVWKAGLWFWNWDAKLEILYGFS